MSTTNDVAAAVERLENHLIPYGMSIGGEGVTDIRTVLAALREAQKVVGARQKYVTRYAYEEVSKHRDALRSENAAQADEIKRLREALEFYAADDAQSVEMGIQANINDRPATAALKESNHE